MRPCESAMALLLNCPFSPFSEVTLGPYGSATCCRPAKYSTPLATFVTLPILFGKSPTIFGVMLLVDCVNVEIGAVIVRGCPEPQLKMPPNCHRSVKRCTHDGVLARNIRPGPIGNSNVPLLTRSCVR